jgi:pyridoxine 5-phosphate synthase
MLGPPMVQLSVNVNKIATLRNSRGGSEPRLLEGVEAVLRAGCRGITVHPREDRRHITPDDVHEVAAYLRERPEVELNVEGDPREELIAMVLAVKPAQCTLVPVLPGEITSQAGWSRELDHGQLAETIRRVEGEGVRVSLFVDPAREPIEWAAELGADRVELYTEPYARAFERGEGERSFESYAEAARIAHACGLGVNAGHDLDLANLPLFGTLPHLDEVSIGHALISRALFVGLEEVVGEYLAVLAGRASD